MANWDLLSCLHPYFGLQERAFHTVRKVLTEWLTSAFTCFSRVVFFFFGEWELMPKEAPAAKKMWVGLLDKKEI